MREDWVAAVIREMQVASAEGLSTDRERARLALLAHAAAIPRPATPVERLLLRGVLLDFAWRFGRAFHERFHRSSLLECRFSPALIFERAWSGDASGEEVFARWVDTFFAELNRVHPPSIAERAARLLRDDFRRKRTVAELSASLGVKSSQLAVAFLEEHGISPKEFQCRLRICEALEHMTHEKIDAIARDVGFKSKKGLYQGFAQLTGMTPNEFRKLSPERARDIIETVRLRVGSPRRP